MVWRQGSWVGPSAAALSLAVYLFTLCPTVYVEGAGELIGATYLLGTPHPTGYPLYCLLGRLCTLVLPFGSPAHQINLFSALGAASAVGLLAAFLHRRGLAAAAALGASLAFAFSATFWSQAVIAEVYGMAMVGAVLLLWTGLRAIEGGTQRAWLLLAYVAGLGLTLHLSMVLFWPVLALLLWRHQRQLLRTWVCLAQGLAASALGFSPVIYLVVRNGKGEAFHWGTISSVGQWWDHLSGALYRDSFFSLPAAAMLLNLQRWGLQLAGEFHPALLPLMIWGGWVGYHRDRRLWSLLAGAVGANLVVALNYHRDPNGIGVFFLISILAGAILLAWAVQDLAERGPWGGRQAAARWGIGGLVAAAVLGTQYAGADRSQVGVAHQYGVDLLACLPPGAVLLAEGDDAAFVLDYLQRLEGMRPDVTLYNRMGRGRDLLTGAELQLAAGAQARLRAQREAQLIAEGSRPVYYLFARRLPLEGYRLVPAGLAYRVWPQAASLPGDGLAAVPPVPAPASAHLDPWVRKIQSNYAFMRGEERLARADTAAALEAYREAASLGRDSRSTRFNVALIMLRANKLDEASSEAEAAVRLDPWNPEAHRLLAQIRARQGRQGEIDILHKKAD
ncbi:MAG: DUF2723 domain-containing protein [Candidatus Latescibacteria bacterium]|nr:DUF2723 domain-containing protein [Candidatus Latescibacterota bacterium]